MRILLNAYADHCVKYHLEIEKLKFPWNEKYIFPVVILLTEHLFLFIS